MSEQSSWLGNEEQKVLTELENFLKPIVLSAVQDAQAQASADIKSYIDGKFDSLFGVLGTPAVSILKDVVDQFPPLQDSLGGLGSAITDSVIGPLTAIQNIVGKIPFLGTNKQPEARTFFPAHSTNPPEVDEVE